MKNTHVLLVDDEPHARRLFQSALAMHGFHTTVAENSEEALEQLGKVAADVVLLHWNTPGGGRLATCREIRKRSEIPLIVVSARPAERERIAALNAGADDFLTKPFSMDELATRIRAVTRHLRPAKVCVRLDGVEIDLQSRHVARSGGVALHLTGKEFKLFDYLLSHSGEVVGHGRLLEAVWGPDHAGEIEYLRVLINQLRKKIEPEPARPRYILTEPNTGYRFRLSIPSPK